ncbi:hypothetical protein GTR04_6314 [Trichophyton interdigitale]|nr:hypothetical protein GY631_6209 [Trichophyton interdigitale]KAG5217842.1 hypothetical protein GY632_6153 [Trichophyton interdigitale]KAG8206309.1 hypothetical protein GTR04_6314 [Trichophyton interdigitale]
MKRKASLSTILSPRSSTSFYDRTVSPIPCSIGDAMVIDDTPQHLHSRTRKRFRNDRPDEQAVYDNTLRWLFSAQRQAENHGLYPEPITSIDDSLQGLEEDPSFQEDSTTTSLPKPDPLQKTLHHFFRPASAPARVSLAEANGNNATPNNSTDTNTSLSASTHVMSSQVPSSSSTSVGDASLSLSTTSGAGPGNGTDAVECEDIDMDRDTHTFTASATALTPAFQQRAWMDGKDLTQPSSCYYLLS